MNAKEKAIEIYDSYWNFCDIDKSLAIQCAIIHVKGIIDCLDTLTQTEEVIFEIEYWQQVLTELNQM